MIGLVQVYDLTLDEALHRRIAEYWTPMVSYTMWRMALLQSST